MAADARKTTSDMFISRKSKKNRIRVNANSTVGTGNKDMINDTPPDTSPISVKTKITPESMSPLVMMARKVPVLYYLARNGHIEHPHLVDVPLSSPHGLYLRDVMNTLNYHRGKGMANMYSWSFKRSYKNGYVWHDLSEDDLIKATNGNDYVLKGSELLQVDASQIPTEKKYPGKDCSSTPVAAMEIIRRRNQSWSSFDNPQEYMVVKCESSRELAAKFAGADAATQTGEQRRRRSFDREEIPSPPPSNSSSEVSEGVSGPRQKDLTVEDQHDVSGRMKASEVLMQLITCGTPSRLKM